MKYVRLHNEQSKNKHKSTLYRTFQKIAIHSASFFFLLSPHGIITELTEEKCPVYGLSLFEYMHFTHESTKICQTQTSPIRQTGSRKPSTGLHTPANASLRYFK